MAINCFAKIVPANIIKPISFEVHERNSLPHLITNKLNADINWFLMKVDLPTPRNYFRWTNYKSHGVWIAPFAASEKGAICV